MVGLLAVLGSPLAAQENLDFGKTPAQLFASDCAICHKSPQGLAAKGGGILGLESFLREHYTASRESAAAIAGYLRAAGNAPATPPGRKPRAKGDDKKKPDASKTGAGKPGEAKSGDGKPADAKPSEAKPADAKPADTKPAEPKVEPKAESKPAEPKPAESKPAESKPAESKPAEGGKKPD